MSVGTPLRDAYRRPERRGGNRRAAKFVREEPAGRGNFAADGFTQIAQACETGIGGNHMGRRKHVQYGTTH